MNKKLIRVINSRTQSSQLQPGFLLIAPAITLAGAMLPALYVLLVARESIKKVFNTLLIVSQRQYSPEGVMSIRSDYGMYRQNLRDDSKVLKTIINNN